MKKTKKECPINNVECPFCGSEINGEFPNGLKLKEIAKLISQLTMAEQREREVAVDKSQNPS